MENEAEQMEEGEEGEQIDLSKLTPEQLQQLQSQLTPEQLQQLMVIQQMQEGNIDPEEYEYDEEEEGEYQGEDEEEELTEEQQLMLQAYLQQQAEEEEEEDEGQDDEDNKEMINPSQEGILQQQLQFQQQQQSDQKLQMQQQSQANGAEGEEQVQEIQMNLQGDQQFDQGKHKEKTQSEEDVQDELDDETLRKVRRDLIENLNRERKDKQLQPFYLELLSNIIATDYAKYLENNEPSQKFFNQISQQYQYDGTTSYMCFIRAKFEEDMERNKVNIHAYFMEIGYLFLEVDQDKEQLMLSSNNHIGLGVSCDDSQIVIVLIISERKLSITRISEVQKNSIEIHGKMLEEKIGIFAIKVESLEQKEIKIIYPDKIQYIKPTREFIATIEGVELDQTNRLLKMLLLYTRGNPDSIPYQKQTKDKMNLKHLDFQFRVPCLVYPDPRYIKEDELAKLQQEAEANAKKQELLKQKEQKEEKRIKASQVEDEVQQEEEEEVEKNEEEEEDESKKEVQEIPIQQQKPESKEPVISNREIKEDLETAIKEAENQHHEFLEQNQKLQEKIKLLKGKTETYADKSGETAMNQHKYLNTLAHVHQIRLDLKNTQDRYNNMASELQKKLDDKQVKCKEIKTAFMELKKEVARKAQFSRNDKTISEKQIEEWEQYELDKGKILQELRLDILRLRNTLIKNQKILKKKEELAEGLHLIDFEQLKIENQTLNEKIEERNEDLHKLKKKNTNTVQILTHTREKLAFIQAKNQELKKSSDLCQLQAKGQRKKLSELKDKKEKVRLLILALQQKTGIVRSYNLSNDYKNLQQRIKQYQEEEQQLKDKLLKMHQAIKEYDKQQELYQQSRNN